LYLKEFKKSGGANGIPVDCLPSLNNCVTLLKDEPKFLCSGQATKQHTTATSYNCCRLYQTAIMIVPVRAVDLILSWTKVQVMFWIIIKITNKKQQDQIPLLAMFSIQKASIK